MQSRFFGYICILLLAAGVVMLGTRELSKTMKIEKHSTVEMATLIKELQGTPDIEKIAARRKEEHEKGAQSGQTRWEGAKSFFKQFIP